ncbi:MAG TPA: ATP-binding protein [Candidatus Polarisedimenticolia bacterium]|nr:ATP-binding protein [Candidatus Polarisedimenticolia bacterium]
MTRGPGSLAERYRFLLQRHVEAGDEETLQQGYQLGRDALVKGVGILEIVAHHDKAVRAVLQDSGAPERILKVLAGAQSFLLECLSPYEMTHQTFRETQATWRKLNERLEGEAKRIAHALHDESGQLLATVHISLADVARALPPQHRRQLQEVRGILDQIEEQLRRLSHELRPTILDDLGLVPALEFLAEGVSKRAGLAVAVDGRTDGRLPQAVETALYRIVQEALTNVSRHARARRADVRVSQEGGTVRCVIRDDGTGFDLPNTMAPGGRRGLGLVGIKERLSAVGGTLSLSTSPGRGTELSITISLENQHVSPNSAC